MPALVHFNNALSNGVLVTSTQVARQANGLIDVQIDYVGRAAKLSQLMRLFYLDAPPPVFPASDLSRADLVNGKLFMVSSSTAQANGIATISARYAGVAFGIEKAFVAYDYRDFSANVPVYVTLDGNFGGYANRYLAAYRDGQDGIPNDFFSMIPAFYVIMSGRVATVRYTYAELAETGATSQIAVTKPKGLVSGVTAKRIENNQNGDAQGRFGATVNATTGVLDAVQTTSGNVSQFAEQSYNGFSEGFPPANFSASAFKQLSTISTQEWQVRGVSPVVEYSRSEKADAVTPSVLVREITYTAQVAQS